MRPFSSLLGAVLLFAGASLPRAGAHPPPPLLAPVSPAAAAAQSVTVTASSSSVQVDEEVSFEATVSGIDGPPVQWRFLGNVAGEGPSVTISFPSSGTFRVEAVARDTMRGGTFTGFAEIVVSDPEFSLRPDQLTIRVRETQTVAVDGNGSESVNWGSDDTRIATVSQAGAVTGVSPGSTSVYATVRSITHKVQVEVTPEPDFTLQPDSLTLEVRATATVAVQWTNPVNSASLTWSSDHTHIAQVTALGEATGRVTGISAGRTQVNASAGRLSRSVVVTVLPAPDSTPQDTTQTPVVQRGCLRRLAWIWCDDFEDGRRMGAYFEYDSAGGRFMRRDSVGRNGSWGMAATFTPGRTGAGWLRVAFGRVPGTLFFPRADTLGWRDSLGVGTDTSRVRHREIWWRFWVRYPADWRGGGGNRLSAATILADRAKAQAMVAFVWAPSTSPRPGALSIDPTTGVDASGTVRTTRYEDFSRLRFLGTAGGNTLFASPGDNRWHCVEGHARLNDAGRSNAVLELFVDGKPEARRDGFDWVRGYRQYGINAVVFDNLWPEGTPRTQTRYLDDLAISTARIGCEDR